MSDLQMCFENARGGYWQSPYIAQCGCKGTGWFLSEVDTWHECRFHSSDGLFTDPEAIEWFNRDDPVLMLALGLQDAAEKAAGLIIDGIVGIGY